MADGVEFKIEGLESVLGKLETVADDIKRKGGRFALRKATEVVRDAAKENATNLNDPKTGRRISDNIAMRFSSRTFRRTGDLMFRVGVMHGAVLPKEGDNPDTGAGGPTPHWRLLEFGTEKMAARPFMRRALSENIQRVIDTFVLQYDKALDRAIKRAAKQAAQNQ